MRVGLPWTPQHPLPRLLAPVSYPTRLAQTPLPCLLAPVSFPAIGVRSEERSALHQFPGPRDSNGVSCLYCV